MRPSLNERKGSSCLYTSPEGEFLLAVSRRWISPVSSEWRHDRTSSYFSTDSRKKHSSLGGTWPSPELLSLTLYGCWGTICLEAQMIGTASRMPRTPKLLWLSQSEAVCSTVPWLLVLYSFLCWFKACLPLTLSPVCFLVCVEALKCLRQTRRDQELSLVTDCLVCSL